VFQGVFQAKVSEDRKLGLHVGKFMTEETDLGFHAVGGEGEK
jgi:hypothetical protein